MSQPCWKKDGGRCCCNCANQRAIYGHPWVTGTSIMTPTGDYVCGVLGQLVASRRHGLCEEWTKKQTKHDPSGQEE